MIFGTTRPSNILREKLISGSHSRRAQAEGQHFRHRGRHKCAKIRLVLRTNAGSDNGSLDAPHRECRRSQKLDLTSEQGYRCIYKARLSLLQHYTNQWLTAWFLFSILSATSMGDQMRIWQKCEVSFSMCMDKFLLQRRRPQQNYTSYQYQEGIMAAALIKVRSRAPQRSITWDCLDIASIAQPPRDRI